MAEARVVLITAPAQEAPGLARALLERRLAACCNLLEGVRSLYWWEGKLQDDGETLILAKTQAARLPALIQAVRELHSYSVPEVIALPVLEGNERYVKWVLEETGGE